MSINLARVANTPEPPAMEVELVEDVGLQSAAPAAAPPPSQAPEIGEAPVIEPTPAPAVMPTTPAPRVTPTPARPQKPAPAAKAPRVSRIGDDFLKGIAEAPAAAKAAPSAAKFDARAKASVAQLIADQIRPCALRQRELGAGANRIQVTLNLQLHPSAAACRRSPTVVSVSGDDGENAQFVDLVVNQAIASYRQCSPLRLPAELYQTPEGGWANINMRYRVP